MSLWLPQLSLAMCLGHMFLSVGTLFLTALRVINVLQRHMSYNVAQCLTT